MLQCYVAANSAPQILCQPGASQEALVGLRRMDQRPNVPLENTYVHLLQACMKRNALNEAREVHAHIVKSGLESDVFLGEYVVSTFLKCGSLADALRVFQKLPSQTVACWNAIISGYIKSGRAQEALGAYRQMRGKGVQPNKYTILGLIKACSTLRDVKASKQIHAEAARHKFDCDVAVGNGLITMYSNCESIAEARNVFDSLPHRTLVSWNSMIAGYAQQNQGEKALQLFAKMQVENVEPDGRTFVSLLRACISLASRELGSFVDGRWIKLGALQEGLKVAEAIGNMYTSDVHVGTALVNMYVSCGNLMEARYVFDTLSARNVVSWNVMVAGYAEHGEGSMALELYCQMKEENVQLDERTIVAALKACSSLAVREANTIVDGVVIKVETLKKGKAIHFDAAVKGLESNIFVGNSLIDMYGKCGGMLDAKAVFNLLSHRNVVSWNVLITGYANQGKAEAALQLYSDMRIEGISPNDRTFVALLKAYTNDAARETNLQADFKAGSVKMLQMVKALHAEIVHLKYEGDVYIQSSIVNIYGTCGSILDATYLFENLRDPNVVSWNAMIAVYVEHEKVDSALQLYLQMCEKAARPDDRTFVSVLKAISLMASRELGVIVNGEVVKEAALCSGKAIHAELALRGYEFDVFIGNTLVDMYAKSGSLKDARCVFDALVIRNVVSWNAMIAGYAQQEQGEEAIAVYLQMWEDGVHPDSRTFVAILKAVSSFAAYEGPKQLNEGCVKVNSLQKVKTIHYEAFAEGLTSDVFVTSILVTMYASCGTVQDARLVFDTLSETNTVSWNAMIAGYAEAEQLGQALQLHSLMLEEGVKPDDWTFASLLKACSNSGALKSCKQIHNGMIEDGFDWSPVVTTALIHAYGRCGSMVDAQKVFDAYPQHEWVAWNALIAGYARVGDYEKTVQRFREMQRAGIKADGVTFLSLISACSHAGLVGKGLEYFNLMVQFHGISAGFEHYVCVLDLLCRAGLLWRAEELIINMPMEPGLPMWLSLLGSCRKFGNIELGRRAFDNSVRLEPQHAAAYVIMSNMYANAGMSDRAMEIDEMRWQADAGKKPGQSWIEHNQEVHVFVAGDGNHVQSEHIHESLQKFSSQVLSESM